MLKLRQPTVVDVLFLIALLFVGVQLAQILSDYVQFANNAVRFPYPIEYGEAPVLEQVLRLGRGLALYRNEFAAQPWTMTTTPPLFQLAQVPLADGTFAAGRSMSIASAVASAIFIALILWQLTRDVVASLIPAALLFVFPHVAYWSVLNRVDTFGLALSLCGLCLTVWLGRRWPFAVLAGLIFALAACVKTPFIFAGTATAFVYLLHQRARRAAFALLSTSLGVTIAIYAAVSIATNGAFWLNVFTLNNTPFETFRLLGAFINIVIHSAFVLLAGIIYLALDRTLEPTKAWPFALPYLVFTFLVSLLAGKVGADLNDLLEMVAALCVLTGATLAWFGRNTWFRIGALAVLALQLTDLSEWTVEEIHGVLTSRYAMRMELDKLSTLVKSAEGNVLADEFLGVLTLNGYPIRFQPVEYRWLGESGVWDESALIQRIQQREYKAILLYEPVGGVALIVQRWSPNVRNTIYANYTVTGRIAETLVYTPKP